MKKYTTKKPQITVYLPQHLILALKEEAKKQKRSMNSQVVWFLEQSLNIKSHHEKETYDV